MIIQANKVTKEITGYATVGQLDSDSEHVVFNWSGITPEPPQNFYLNATNDGILAKSQTTLDSETNVRLAKLHRLSRDELLRASDYTQLDDSTHPGTKAQWEAYRQSLRDITLLTHFPHLTDSDWAVKPT